MGQDLRIAEMESDTVVFRLPRMFGMGDVGQVVLSSIFLDPTADNRDSRVDGFLVDADDNRAQFVSADAHRHHYGTRFCECGPENRRQRGEVDVGLGPIGTPFIEAPKVGNVDRDEERDYPCVEDVPLRADHFAGLEPGDPTLIETSDLIDQHRPIDRLGNRLGRQRRRTQLPDPIPENGKLYLVRRRITQFRRVGHIRRGWPSTVIPLHPGVVESIV